MTSRYFDWLKEQVEYFDQRGTHEHLFSFLYVLDYIPAMDKDENRALDGLALRDEFGLRRQPIVIPERCSFLEFLVALARRMNYIYAAVDEDRTADCFWTLLENLGIADFTDDVWTDNLFPNSSTRIVTDKVKTVLERTYNKDGSGGLFPLQYPRTNQRNVEVWYQMNQYLTEVMRNEGRI